MRAGRQLGFQEETSAITGHQYPPTHRDKDVALSSQCVCELGLTHWKSTGMELAYVPGTAQGTLFS